MNKEIKTVSLIGLGAIGITFGEHLLKTMEAKDLRIVADSERIKRYKEQGVYSNGKKVDFNYVDAKEKVKPSDLALFMVKSTGLKAAIKSMKNHIDKDTIIISALNGISSEEIIGQEYGFDNMLYCVAQGMDSQKTDNKLSYTQMGKLVFGEKEEGLISENVKKLARFFDKTEFPYEIETQMINRQWGKFMFNVGLNQTVAINKGRYETVQKDGQAREMFIQAMREVQELSRYEGVTISEKNFDYWMWVLSKLNPRSKPSMAQDVEAGRPTEVDLFAKTVIELGEKHGLPTPINRILYEKLMKTEENPKK